MSVQKLQAQKVAVLCSRYHYRGILAEVFDDCLVLNNSAAVEVSGPSQMSRPQMEDPVGTPLIINRSAIEIVWQPQWVHAPLPGEDVSTSPGDGKDLLPPHYEYE